MGDPLAPLLAHAPQAGASASRRGQRKITTKRSVEVKGLFLAFTLGSVHTVLRSDAPIAFEMPGTDRAIRSAPTARAVDLRDASVTRLAVDERGADNCSPSLSCPQGRIWSGPGIVCNAGSPRYDLSGDVVMITRGCAAGARLARRTSRRQAPKSR